MRLARDLWRVCRAVAVAAAAVVTVLAALTLMALRGGVPLPALTGDPTAPAPATAFALVVAGAGLLLLAPPGCRRWRRWTGIALASSAAGIGAVGVFDAAADRRSTATVSQWLIWPTEPLRPLVPPAAALALLLAGAAIATIDVGGRAGRTRWARFRPADPLLAGAATIALVALVTSLFEVMYPDGTPDDAVMSPYVATAVLALAAGTALARPDAGAVGVVSGSGPGAAVGRQLAPTLLFLPFAAAVASALATQSGIRRPAAAITAGVVLAVLALFAVVVRLVRFLEAADREQRRLVTALREKQEFTDTLLQSMHEGVAVLDAHLRIRDVNRRWHELTGRSRREALGTRPSIPGDQDGEVGDHVLHRPDGSAVPVLATMAAIPDRSGRPRAYVATYVDITDRKRAEEALTAHAAEVEEANGRLREANRRLEEALTFKNDLMSMLSHEVAQPVSSIASLAELLTDDWADLPDDIRLELASKIDKNTRRLIGMMNDLTLLFRLDTGKVTARRTPVPVREVVEGAVATLPAGATDVVVDVGAEMSALADRGHLGHVLQNLLSNAVRYGAAPIEIRSWRDGDQVLLTVRDHGTGIPAELVPDLFDRFTRGAGLGLFIVRHLVEANGGTVRYEAAEPQGARLVVTLEPTNATVPGAVASAGDRG